MEFLTYPSIEQLYKTLEVVEHGEVVATEKLHGTNTRFGFGLNGKTGGLDFGVGSRNLMVNHADDNAHQGFAKWAKDHFLAANYILDEYTRIFGSVPYGVVIFGEWVGKGIQKGVNYCEGKDFYGFGIAVQLSDRVHYASYDERVALFDKFGIKSAPLLYRGVVRVEDALNVFNEIINRKSKVAEDNGLDSVLEGVVIEPAVPRLNKFGHLLLAKHKAEKFMEVAKAPREVSPDDEFIARVGTAFANTFITSERVNHVLDQCRERGEEVKSDMSDMRFLVKAVLADVEKECADAFIFLDALVERKKASKSITRRIGNLYEEMLRAAELEKHLTSV